MIRLVNQRIADPPVRPSTKICEDLRMSHINNLRSRPTQDELLAGMATLEALVDRRVGQTTTEPHVGVIGAGLSGLRCADILLQHGFKVTVIEGRDRIGGRLHQEKLPNGRLVDVGPNWIHGTRNNPIMDLAEQTETVTGNQDGVSHLFNDDGTLFPELEGAWFSTCTWGIIEDAFKYSHEHTANICKSESLYNFFQDKVMEKIPDTAFNFEWKRQIVLQLSEMWGCFVGNPVTTQSLKFFWMEECIGEGNVFCAGTFKKILEAIARPVLARATMMFNKKATSIAYRVDSVDDVNVYLDDGECLAFDEVVVTCPLGWLKRNLGAFTPSLPPRLTKAIESIGYGSLEKVYIAFPKAFWLSDTGGSHNSPGAFQWLAPNYLPETNPERWGQEVVELASFTPETSHPTLLFYLYGDQSRYLTSRLAEISGRSNRADFLVNHFRPYYSRMPNYSENSTDCQPTSWLATAWLRDELAGNGSYSNFQTGLEDGDNDIRAMRVGLPANGLWFAGEHTAPFIALGTATGAYWSGEAVGKRMAACYGRRLVRGRRWGNMGA